MLFQCFVVTCAVFVILKFISLTVYFVSGQGTHTANSNTPNARLIMLMIYGAGNLQLRRGVARD